MSDYFKKHCLEAKKGLQLSILQLFHKYKAERKGDIIVLQEPYTNPKNSKMKVIFCTEKAEDIIDIRTEIEKRTEQTNESMEEIAKEAKQKYKPINLKISIISTNSQDLHLTKSTAKSTTIDTGDKIVEKAIRTLKGHIEKQKKEAEDITFFIGEKEEKICEIIKEKYQKGYISKDKMYRLAINSGTGYIISYYNDSNNCTCQINLNNILLISGINKMTLTEYKKKKQRSDKASTENCIVYVEDILYIKNAEKSEE